MSHVSPLSEDPGLIFRLGMVPVFLDTPQKSLCALLQNATQLMPPPGTQIVGSDTTADHLHIVLQGYVGSYAGDGVTSDDAAGAQQLLNCIGANSFIGLSEIFLNHPHKYAYRTFDDTHIVSIPTEDLLSALEKDWVLLRSMLCGMSQRIHGLVHQINSLKTQKAEQRLAAHFLDLMEQQGGGMAFELPYGKKKLAAHLGLVPESLSRALKRLKERGVHVEGRSITISDPQSLMDVLGKLRAEL
ncbi:helix-turn-helix domain-containing protein [Magnetovibrio blakemorei]|nr:helix-turn-helix domain-containing protein [Magnetovibrio blakemorei]